MPLVNLISVWFQIRDDYMNLQSPAVSARSYSKSRFTSLRYIIMQYKSNKGFCEDLTEGKFSFPVVHGVRADTSNRQILSKSNTSHV